MPEIPFPRGVRDFKPNEAIFINEVLKRIESIYQLFGFYPIDTPSFERIDVLRAKHAIGEDEKLIYELKGDELALRYDHTVSLARYMAMHKESPLPFKRYYIGKVWRREEPQRLRYREFTQSDVDIIGGGKITSDAEVIATTAIALDALGIEYKIKISDRRIMEQVLAALGVDQNSFTPVLRAIDKLEKIGEQKLFEQLTALKIERSVTERLTQLLNINATNEDKIKTVSALIKENAALDELEQTIALIAKYNIKGEIQVDFSIVRGLDYYTGLVFEFKFSTDQNGPTIASGGRYDSLTEVLGAAKMPAVGCSIGIDRLIEYMGYSASTANTYAKAFIAYINDANYPYALSVATKLRSSRINTDINISAKNISNQLAHASALNIKYVVIVGDQEQNSNKVKLRNLIDGQEAIMEVQEAINVIRGVT